MTALSRLSRFRATRVVTDPDLGKRFAEWRPPPRVAVGERLYVVTQADLGRPDLISYKMYDTVDLWWMVLWYNNILDPFSMEVGDRLRIPDHETLMAAVRKPVDEAESEAVKKPVPVIRRYAVQPFQRILDSEVPAPATETPAPYSFSYGMQVPAITGLVHFELQVSTREDFASLLMTKSSLLAQTNWYYFNPYVNGASGAHEDFPQAGIEATAFQGHYAYFRFTGSDPILSGEKYYVRHRALSGSNATMWTSPPPFVLRP